LLIDVGADFVTIENQECFHGRVAHSLVSVHKRMSHDKGVSESCCFLDDRWVKICPSERDTSLSNGRIKCTQVADSDCATGLKEDQAMQFQDLINGQVAHGLTTTADRVRHSS